MSLPANPKGPNIQELFRNAHEEGTLLTSSLQALEDLDVGAQIQAGIGVNINSVKASEVVLVTMMIDDSGSIRFSGNAQTVRDGHNMVLDSLIAAKQTGNILLHTCYLNGDVLFPYLPLGVIDEVEQKRSGNISYIPNPLVARMDKQNYDPNLGTPLYDQTVIMLGRVLAKYQEFAEGGVVARTVTLIITDGEDQHSTRANAGMVKSLVTDLLGEHHIVAAMGIESNGAPKFQQIFREMGIQDQWILTPKNTTNEIRKAFQVFSQSAVRASQSIQSFAPALAGGFLSN